MLWILLIIFKFSLIKIVKILLVHIENNSGMITNYQSK